MTGGDRTNLNQEFVEWVNEISRGVRVLTLRKLLLFMFLARERVRSIDWKEWINRNPEVRSRLQCDLSTYLAERDMIEVKYFASLLRWNIRTVFEYWDTLRLIDVYTH